MEFITEAFFDAGEMNSSHLRVMRFARLARALRGVRVIRLLRYIGSLRTIVPLGVCACSVFQPQVFNREYDELASLDFGASPYALVLLPGFILHHS